MVISAYNNNDRSGESNNSVPAMIKKYKSKIKSKRGGG